MCGDTQCIREGVACVATLNAYAKVLGVCSDTQCICEGVACVATLNAYVKVLHVWRHSMHT